MKSIVCLFAILALVFTYFFMEILKSFINFQNILGICPAVIKWKWRRTIDASSKRNTNYSGAETVHWGRDVFSPKLSKSLIVYLKDSVTQIVSDNPQLDWWFAIVNKSTQRIIAKAEGCAELQNPDLQRFVSIITQFVRLILVWQILISSISTFLC